MKNQAARQYEPQVTVRGTVKRVYYASPTWSAGKMISEEGDEVSFAGNLYAKNAESVILTGRWAYHPKFGRQLNVKSMILDLVFDDDGLVHYLKNHPDITGIGQKRAELIAETFGDRFEEVLLNTPEKFIQEIGLPEKVVENLKHVWERNRQCNAVATKLASFNLTHYQINYLINHLGDSALSILEADPYALIGQLKGFSFKRIDKIARNMGVSKSQPERIRAGILHCVDEALSNGHCYTEFQEVLDMANKLLVMDELESEELIEKELKGLIASNKLVGIFKTEGYLIGKPSIYQKECDLASIFQKGNLDNPHVDTLGNPEALVTLLAPTLNKEQKQAAIAALSKSISLISGPGGAGKSYTIAAITSILESNNLDVVLAAPTGKAAKRLEQLSKKSAMTLHRLLGYNGFAFRNNRGNPISADVVIVDEVSICSTELMWQFFISIDLNKTAVVLVGDHNQLPPIGGGNPLRDLIQSRVLPTVVLTQCVRQAGVLKENCSDILAGKVKGTDRRFAKDESCAWYVSDDHREPESARDFIVQKFTDGWFEQLGFDLTTDIQVLTPTHKGILGTRELNIALQRVLQKSLHNVDVEPVEENKRPKFYLHDKVIQTRNNYKIGIMNGAVGQIVHLDSKKVVVNFDGKEVEIDKAKRGMLDIELAYAISIHRFQGSEVPCAVLVIHRSHAFMHHRNLFYTGVTRAKETAVIVGDRWGIQSCAKRVQVDSRRTYLSLLLDQDR